MPKAALTSTGRKKLKRLGVELPALPVTTVGALPLQVDLQELRYKVAKGVQSREELERKERLATEMWLHHQEKAGVDVLVDGEMNRTDLINFFAGRITGFESGGTVRIYGNRYTKKPIIREKIEWKGPMTVDAWKSAQRMSHKVLKAHLTGPATLLDWSFNEYYASREEALKDLTAVIRKEVEALTEAGAKIIQIDESAISSRPQDFPLVAECIRQITCDLKPYFILHHAYGDLEPLWPKMRRLPVDNFSLEMANSHFRLLPLLKKFPTPKDVSIGFVDSHSRLIESPAEIRNRLQKILEVIPLGQLWLSSDSDLKTRTTDEAIGKLAVMAREAIKRRAKLN